MTKRAKKRENVKRGGAEGKCSGGIVFKVKFKKSFKIFF